MAAIPPPPDEAERLSRLQELRILDSPEEPVFDALARAAAQVCGTPIALLSLVDADRQWFKAHIGLSDARETPRAWAFCDHAIRDDLLLEVENAACDPRFSDNPLVTGDPGIRFYAGAPIRLGNGTRPGTLCVIDRSPRRLDARQRSVLVELASVAAGLLELRERDLAHGEAAQARLRKDLGEARALGVELAASEAKFRVLSEQSPLGVFHTDSGGLCTYANRRWCEIYGLSPEQALGTGWMVRLHSEDRLALAAAWESSAAASESFDREFRLQHEDGSVRQVHARAAPLCGQDGKTSGFVGVVEDVTERLALAQRLRDSEAFLDRANRIGGLGVWAYDIGTGILTWTEHTRRIHEVEFGYVPQTGAGIDFYPPEARPLIERAFSGAVERGEGFSLELPMVTARGRNIWVQATGEADFDPQGRPCRVVGTLRDITVRKELELKLARERELLEVTLYSISDAVLSTDPEGRIVWMNPAAERLLGWADGDARGLDVERVLHMLDESSREAAENPVRLCLRLGEAVSAGDGHVLLTRDGRELSMEDSASPIRDADGSLRGAVMVFRDVSEQRRLNREMSHRARHDALTGLANRSEFEARLHEALEGAQQFGQVHALLFIDLDQFKLVNDACGHAAGDQLLRQVSRLLEGSIRAGDLLARLGGDEFAVILRHCRGDHAHRVAQQICERFEQYRFHHDGRRFRVGASIGLVSITDEWTGTAAVLQAADTCCYAAKEAGRNRVHAWMSSDEDMHARRASMRWASRLESALDEGRFELYFQRVQPVLQDHEDDGHIELLLRLREDGELVSPGAFLPAAERFGLASRIDRWVLTEALRWMQGREALPGTLAINLSGQSIGDRAFHRFASKLLRDSNLPLQRLCFEITETAAITALQDAATFIAEMRRLGVRIALDDFGAGASSFGYLKQLPVDYLKIDGQFVRNLVNDRFDQTTVSCFCQIAAELGIGTIAEFVENTETLEALRALGVNMAQGYLLHRPQSLAEWAGDWTSGQR